MNKQNNINIKEPIGSMEAKCKKCGQLWDNPTGLEKGVCIDQKCDVPETPYDQLPSVLRLEN